MGIHPHNRPACRDCTYLDQMTDKNGRERPCVRANEPTGAQRMDGPLVALFKGTCGVNGRFFVPIRQS